MPRSRGSARRSHPLGGCLRKAVLTSVATPIVALAVGLEIGPRPLVSADRRSARSGRAPRGKTYGRSAPVTLSTKHHCWTNNR